MPLPLPKLDDRTYADLVAEARSLIPTYDPDWTNHNPSDPGITLIELFAWLAEMLIYRLDQVTDDHLRVFLKLLRGPDWPLSQDLREETRLAIVSLRARPRIITAADCERQATKEFNQWLAAMQQRQAAGEPLDEWWLTTRLDPAVASNLPSNVAAVRRAYCVPQRYLDAGTEAARRRREPGYLSVIILPQVAADSHEPAPQPPAAQRRAVWGYLEGRRVLTTRHHVVGPIYAAVEADVLVAPRADVRPERLPEQIAQRLNDFLHPITGGPDHRGWPFGRDVYASELYELLEAMPEVDYVPNIMLGSECPPGAERCVAAPLMWHDSGDPIGLRLEAHHLPRPDVTPARIVAASVFVPVQVTLHVRAVAPFTPAEVSAAAKTATRRFFHPLYGDRTWASETRTFTRDALRSALRSVEEIDGTDIDVHLAAAPSQLVRDAQGQVVGVRLGAGELADLADVEVTLESGA